MWSEAGRPTAAGGRRERRDARYAVCDVAQLVASDLIKKSLEHALVPRITAAVNQAKIEVWGGIYGEV